MLSANDILHLLLALGLLLGCGRALGELVRRLGQPPVLGELLAGIVLGPTVLGHLAPDVTAALFPPTGPIASAMGGISTIAIVLFLLVAGMEVDLSTMFRQGRNALGVGIASVFVPFVLGLGLALLLPGDLGRGAHAEPLTFALFVATALSISALPMIARTLMDLNLYRSDLGMLIVATAIFNDLVGWVVFALVISLMPGTETHRFPIGMTVLLTLAFAAVMLTVVRWIIHRILPWLQAHLSWPGGVLGFALTGTLFSAALTEWIGVHAIFGAFLFGVALGDSQHLRERTRSTIEQFVSFVFAPLFFAAIGLRVNFVQDFDWLLVGVVLVVSCVGKIFPSAFAARKAGMPLRQAYAVGAGLNSRGVMEIILGVLALQVGLIDGRMFVALVVMALVTSAMAGPLIQKLLRREKARRFTDFVGARSFIAELKALTREDAIRELAAVSGAEGVPLEKIAEQVIEREKVTATGIGRGIALPHARIEGLKAPQVALGISRAGLDFDSPDGEPTRLVALVLTPAEDMNSALELYRQIVGAFNDGAVREAVLKVKTYTELLAVLASLSRPAGH